MFWSRSLITRGPTTTAAASTTSAVICRKTTCSSSTTSSLPSAVTPSLVTSIKRNRTTVIAEEGFNNNNNNNNDDASSSSALASASQTQSTDIVIENVEETSYISTTGGDNGTTHIEETHQTSQSSTSSSSMTPSDAFVDCPSLDPYARAKITNFLKRISKAAGFRQMSVPQHQQSINKQQSSSSFETHQIAQDTYRSRMILPLPAEFGLRIAEGEAGNIKDAETLAAMHAAQILDELGFQLYTLGSMQKKHAMQVRSSSNGSRWAPMPDDPLRPADTASPPPLRRRSVVDDSENGAWMVVDLSVGGLNGSNNLPFLAPEHTMLSPFILDPGALNRVKMLWRSLNSSVQTRELPISLKTVATAVKQEEEFNNNNEGGDNAAAAATTVQMTVAELRVADFVGHNGPASVAHLVALGKAADRSSATILAAMHLELILDCAGVPLYPQSKEKQQQHIDALTQFGRSYATFSNSLSTSFSIPPPLKGLHRMELVTSLNAADENAQQQQQQNSSSSSSSSTNHHHNNNKTIVTSSNATGEQWVARNVTLLSLEDSVFKNVSGQSAFDHIIINNNNNSQQKDSSSLDDNTPNSNNKFHKQDPIEELLEFLAASGESRPDPFISIRMPDGRVRTTVVLPAVQGLRKNEIYGGVAEAANRKDSRLLAAQHAIDVLNTLGVLIHPGDQDQQSDHEARRLAKGKVVASQVDSVIDLPPPMRLIGLNFASANHSSSNSGDDGSSANDGQQQKSTIFYDLPETATPKPEKVKSVNIKTRSSSATTTTKPKSSRNYNNQEDQDDDEAGAILDDNDLVNNQSSNGNNNNNNNNSALLLDPNDRFIRQTQAPPHYWDMRPNTPDGFILAEGKAVVATGASYSISSIRNIDPSCRDRIGALAGRLGLSAADIVTTYTALTKDNTVYYSTQIEVPSIPVETFGTRIAIGEAQDQKNSEILACMHAEAILDRLGLPLFPYDDELQTKHAESVRALGRFAPLPTDNIQFPGNTASPPPLRMRSLQQLIEVMTAPVQGRGSHYLQLPMELYSSSEALDLTSVQRVQFYLRRHRRTVIVPDVFFVADHHGVNVHIAVLHVPTSSTVDDVLSLSSSNENNNNKGENSIMPMMNYKIPLGHQQFGRRTAVGVAEKRRDAEVLCFMHAEQIVDALGLPLFPLDSLQRKHSQRVSKLFGRRAVTFSTVTKTDEEGNPIQDEHDDLAPDTKESAEAYYRKKAKQRVPSFTVNPETVVTPPALRLDVNAIVKPKIIPQPDEDVVIISSSSSSANQQQQQQQQAEALSAWQEYVKQAESYSDQAKKCDRHSKLAADRVPRTGDSLIDEALDEAEATEVHRDVRNHLITYCLKMNVEYSQNWNTVQVGTATIRKSFTRVSVPGFTHIEALGIANNKDMSMRKAAHHALHLLKRLDPDFYLFEAEVLIPAFNNNNNQNSQQQQFDATAINTSSGPKNSRAVAAAQSAMRSQNERSSSSRKNRGPDHGSYDRMSGSFTTDGKIRLVNLYTLCNGLAAPVVNHREKVESGHRVQYTTVEVADLSGGRIVGWAQEGGRKTNEPAAYDDLVQTLLKRVPQFASLARLLKTHPHLDPEHIVHLELPQTLEKDLRQLLEEDQHKALIDTQSMEDATTNNNNNATASPLIHHDIDRQEQEAEKKEAEVASKHADDLLSTLDVATTLLLKKSKEVNTLDPMASQRLNAFLKAKQKSRAASKQYKEKFQQRRETLSIYTKKQEILDTVKNNPVTVLCGTTGCGKTTQVPQYLLENDIEQGNGNDSTIIVTQPRRISAISIAQRVAAERLEPIGHTVGYTVRLDSRPGSNINFCTSGVLLRLLQSSPTIDHIKYLIIDEIHERDINSDFLLILVKQLIQKRSDLRVILMSATLQSELFSGYFGGAPVINVEGYVYPCQELFLDELAQTVKERELVTPSTKVFLEGKEEIATLKTALVGGEEGNNNNNNGNYSPDDQQQQQQDYNNNHNNSGAVVPSSKPAYGTLEAPSEIDYPLIAFAIEHARKDFDLHGGSILVFLPGWEEITRIRDMFTGNPQYLVLPLHSSVSAEEQLKCFLPPPDTETVKLILSTNIAESGVTIDDIGCVIDCGRAKEKTFISRRGRTSVGRKEMGTMSQLIQVLASRANVTQRRGRVGRTRPGVCIKLYSKRQFEELPDFATPEILRQPLDALCLQIMALKLGDPLEFLSLALEPPPPQSIEAAMIRLFHLGAVNERRQLSPLGLRLALLPVSPKVGKMILYGAALQCLDSALTLAACADVEPYVTQREMKDLVKISKLEFSANTLSDPISNVNAYYSWVNSKITLPSDKVTELEANRCLSKLSLTTISKYKEQYYEILKQSGFLEKEEREEIAVITNEMPSSAAPSSSTIAAHSATNSNIDNSINELSNDEILTPEGKSQEKKSNTVVIEEESTSTATPVVTSDNSKSQHISNTSANQEKKKPRQYFSNGEIFLEMSPFSSHANSLPLLKALLCSGLFPNVALFRDKRRFRSKLQNMLHPFPSSVVSKVEEEDVSSPFFVYDEMVKTASDPRVFFRNITNCSVWAIILLGASSSHSHMEFRHDLNLAILDDWIVFRVTADALELIQHLKHKFLACIEKKFTSPSDHENNELLSRLQKIIQSLVTEPVRPNDLTTSLWAEKGELVEVDVSRLISETERTPLTPEQIEEKERQDREQVAEETIEAAEELKSSSEEKEEEHRGMRVGLAEDEEDN